MPKFHRIAAFCVMLGAAAWIVTGEFSSVGSAQTAEGKESPATGTPEAEPARDFIEALVARYEGRIRELEQRVQTLTERLQKLTPRNSSLPP